MGSLDDAGTLHVNAITDTTASPADAAASLPLADAAHSRFVQRVRRRFANEVALLEAGLPDRGRITALIDRLLTRGHTLAAALRIARHLVLERLAVLDIECCAPMPDITGAMTALAETTLDLALTQAHSELETRHGVPRNAEGERIDFWIVGMGKLGARELNVSSDIDLIYVYDQAGETAGRSDGRGQISNHEYFAHQVKAVFSLIGDATEHGFVFRVDLALRPNGNSGPSACS